MDARVHELRVNVSGVEERERGGWFARQVLARFCEIVEDRYPGQDISIGRVDLRCTLSAGQLNDAGEVLRCARQLALSIAEDSRSALLDEAFIAERGAAQSVSEP